MKFAAILAVVAANRYDSMNEYDLLVNLESTLSSALSSEARGDGDAAVAKTAAIKNIQKALTARILKRLDDGQPLVEVARKMKAIEGMQPQINDMERRLGIMQSVEPVLENAIKTLQKVVDVRGMGKKLRRLNSALEDCESDDFTKDMKCFQGAIDGVYEEILSYKHAVCQMLQSPEIKDPPSRRLDAMFLDRTME